MKFQIAEDISTGTNKVNAYVNVRNISGKREEIRVLLGIFNSISLLSQVNVHVKRWKKSIHRSNIIDSS